MCDATQIPLPPVVNSVVTSPPYMNELDYVRDNRLRIWLLLRSLSGAADSLRGPNVERYANLMTAVCVRLSRGMQMGSSFIFVVGEATRSGTRTDTAGILTEVFTSTSLRQFKLVERIDDVIPDIRRSRRDLRGTKRETVLVFRRG